MWKTSTQGIAGILFFSCLVSAGVSGQVFTTLANFNGSNGANPYYVAPIQATDGNFYGTTSDGGANNNKGIVFQLTSGGMLNPPFYSFCAQPNCTDGYQPNASVVQASDTNLYGTTTLGGTNSQGTIFQLTLGGTLTTLRSLGADDGQFPYAGLMQATDGNLYGTTSLGGLFGDGGTIYQLTLAGEFNPIHSFTGSDGAGPMTGLIQGTDGYLYGTTSAGGSSSNCANGCGTVFRITPVPPYTLVTLHSFNGNDGSNPSGGIVQATDGNFYGTTFSGGPNSSCDGGCGTVFQITPEGVLSTLHSFDYSDGANPSGALAQATDGNFYGTTWAGGTSTNCTGGCGTVFQMQPTFPYTVNPVHTFDGYDGYFPNGGLSQITDGKLYGTTFFGGSACCGTVFSVAMDLAPFVQVQPTSGTAGSRVVILGINLTGSTGVTFNGRAAQFTIVSPSEITATVPAGATPGPVQVTTPSGTLTSNIAFQVTYPLAVSTSGNGTITSVDGFINCPGVCSHAYPGTQVTLNAIPGQGWAFSGWSGACSGTGSCMVTVNQSVSVSAMFTQLSYTLTVSTLGDGTVTSTDGFINCPGTCSHSYLSNTNVTLNASPAQDWNFAYWTGACGGTGSCVVDMTQSLTVGAVFVGSSALQYTPVTPCRAVDTRNPNGTFGGPPIQGDIPRSFPIPQSGCNIPSTAAAYALNVTLVPIRGHSVGFLTVYPTGENPPNISTMNSWDGRIKANAAIVPAGTNGAVSVYSSDTTNIVVDITGYFEAPNSLTLAFYPLTPCRAADTRHANGSLGGPHLYAGTERDFPVLDATACNIPDTAQAYSLNFTVIPRSDQVWVFTAWPFGQTMPTSSTLNDPTGTVVANAAIVQAGTEGEIATWASADTDLAIDINGYFAPAGTGGLSLYPMTPCRVLDTRKVGNGQPFTGTLSPPVDVVDSMCGPPSSSEAFVLNATVVPAGGPMYVLTLWPDGSNMPLVSTLNAYDGAVTSNLAIVPTTNGKIDANAAGLTQLILDLFGYFAP